MSRFAATAALLIACGIATAPGTSPAAAQTPQLPLGQLLDVLPLPESGPVAAAAAPRVIPAGIQATESDGYSLINPEDYPDDGSLAEAPPVEDRSIDAQIVRREAELADLRAQRREKVDAVEAPITARLNEAEAARAATARRNAQNAAEAPVTARLNQAEAARTATPPQGYGFGREIESRDLAAERAERLAKVDAVEAPVTAELNAAEAARADYDRRRYEDDRAAYERDLAWREQRAEAERIAYWRRVERERACMAGDRRACGAYFGGPYYAPYYGRPYYGRPYYGRPFSRY